MLGMGSSKPARAFGAPDESEDEESGEETEEDGERKERGQTEGEEETKVTAFYEQPGKSESNTSFDSLTRKILTLHTQSKPARRTNKRCTLAARKYTALTKRRRHGASEAQAY